MAMLDVSRRELQRAYRIHYNNYLTLKVDVKETNSCLLLLFYAVECGLKAVWCKRNRIDTTSCGGSKFDSFKHNINLILNDLRSGITLTRSIEYKNGDRINLEKFHECWRYGGKIKDETVIQNELENVYLWIGREL